MTYRNIFVNHYCGVNLVTTQFIAIQIETVTIFISLFYKVSFYRFYYP